MEIVISIPETNRPEVRYVFDQLFTNFLGLPYRVSKIISKTGYKISVSNKTIFIANNFFNTEDLDFLYAKNKLPQKPTKTSIKIGDFQYKYVSMYGEENISYENGNYRLSFDLIAATFFMLSRWEEKTIQKRDNHNRFAASSSTAYKFEFLKRPIVNEYIELLWAMLKRIGVNQNRKKWEFKIIPTHDVDRPLKWWNTKDLGKTIYGYLLQKKIGKSISSLKKYLLNKDPFDTFLNLMDRAEIRSIQSNFFFMTGGNSNLDNWYKIDHPKIVKLIETIKSRGHKIGLHPSYNAYNRLDLLKEEKEKLEIVTQSVVNTGRHHYLRFENPTTWNLWNELNFKWDSTMSYADESGYRCGICYPFNVFDIVNRKELNLIEKPLIVMDASLFLYEKLDVEEAIEKIEAYKSQVRKYNGEFIFLWHNSFLIEDGNFVLEALYN